MSECQYRSAIHTTAKLRPKLGAITMSGGGFQFVASEEPITTAAMNTAMVKAGKVVGKYKAPNV